MAAEITVRGDTQQPRQRMSATPAHTPTVSVLVTARSTDLELPAGLDLLLERTPTVGAQVVVVIGGADDRMRQSLARFRADPRLQVAHLPASSDRAELVDRAVSLATGDVVVLRDAPRLLDCAWLAGVLRTHKVPARTADARPAASSQ